MGGAGHAVARGWRRRVPAEAPAPDPRPRPALRRAVPGPPAVGRDQAGQDTPRSPNLNAYAERFVRSIKEECLSKFVPIGERHLRLAIEEYGAHYHLERNHQGLGDRLIDGEAESAPVHRVECRERLGGIFRSYHRAA